MKYMYRIFVKDCKLLNCIATTNKTCCQSHLYVHIMIINVSIQRFLKCSYERFIKYLYAQKNFMNVSFL